MKDDVTAGRHPRANFDGRAFQNQFPEAQQDNSFFHLLKWLTSGQSKPWARFVDDNLVPDLSGVSRSGSAKITFVNHATAFIQTADLSVVTDPVFSRRVSPFRWMGPQRRRHPGIALDRLPRVDAVVVSHNHYDHMDLQSLAAIQLKHAPQFIVPLGNRRHLSRIRGAKIIELDWWQQASIGNSVITLVPMQHWSLRGLSRRRAALWGGFVFQSSGLKILFSGDSGYNLHFKAIRENFGPLDVSLIPIGAYEPRWFMKKFHMNPPDAVKAHLDLKSALSVAMHFGTFKLSDEGMDDPVDELKRALLDEMIEPSKFHIPKNGETILFEKPEAAGR